MSDIKTPINGHTDRATWNWLDNLLIQPSIGTGSGITPDTNIHYKISLSKLQALIVQVDSVVNNLTTADPGYVADARQLKVLRDYIDNVVSGLVWQEPVIDATATPPVSPSLNDRYLIIGAPSGAWVGHENEIAQWNGTAWVFATASTGWAVYCSLRGEQYSFYGTSWILVSSQTDALLTLAGTGWTTETVKGNAVGIGTLNGSIGAVNGIASLGADGKIPNAQIPALALVDVFTVATEAAMLALGAEQGDMAIRSDTSQVFILSASPATTLGNWLELSILQAIADLKIDKTSIASAFQATPDNVHVPSEKLVADQLAALKGTGWTTESVKGNAVAIATNLSNITLAGGYFSPTDVMGYGGRDLKTVFGVSTVQAAAAALRACMLAGERYKVRLGDYIDLDTFTIPADSVNPTVYPARTLTWNATYQNLRIEIQGFDDYLNVGNSAVPILPHAVMGFKNIPTTAPFNFINTTVGEYKGSMMFHWLHERFEPALVNALGLDPYPIDRLIDGVSTYGWAGSEKIFLQTNVNIFGTTGWAHSNTGTGTQTQWPLFALNPGRKIKKYNGSRSYWWLAEPVAASATGFCLASSAGYADLYNASYVHGVVPAFLV